MQSLYKFFIPSFCLVLLGCQPNQDKLEESISKTIEKNPDLIIKAIENNPHKFISAFQKAANSARQKIANQRKLEENKRLFDNFEKPYTPLIRSDDVIRGNKSAPIVIVEYTDFECPYCSKGTETIKSLRKRFGDRIKVVYKHLPLSFHKNAMISAKYFEALRMQNHELANAFYDEIFKNQSKLRKGESFLKTLSSKLGANMSQLNEDLKSPKIKERIEQDRLEAKKFGIQGTPGYLLNGIVIRGAYPEDYFVKIIDELKKRKLVKL